MRKSMTLVMVIVFILTLGIVLGLTLYLSSMSSTKTLHTFYYSQCKLLTRSASEYALLALSGHSIKDENNCINTINMIYEKIYEINVSIHYIGSGFPSSCQMLSNSLSSDSSESNGTVILDVSVRVKDEPIRITKRLITKI